MASVECKTITGVWGRSPQWDPGGRALGAGLGAKPLKLDAFSILHLQRKPQICHITDIWQSFNHSDSKNHRVTQQLRSARPCARTLTSLPKAGSAYCDASPVSVYSNNYNMTNC